MKNEYKVTRELMMSWAKEFYLQGAANIILFILWCIIGFCGVVMLALLPSVGGDWLDWYLAIMFTALCIFKLFFARFVTMSSRYKMLSKAYGVSEWMRTAEFTQDGIVLSDHNSVATLQYKNIKKIKEKNNVVMIFFSGNMAVRIYKDAFAEGSWEECKEFLYARMK